jgi:hypothetical protein
LAGGVIGVEKSIFRGQSRRSRARPEQRKENEERPAQ